MDIEGATALITGGASGLGLAVAEAFSAAGGTVAILDLNEDAAQAAAARLDGTALVCDVTDAKAVEAAVTELTERSPTPLRVAVNCAGIAPAKRIVGRDGPMDLDEFAMVINVNLIGSFNVMRVAAAAIAQTQPLDEGERGVIVSTASVAAFDGQIGQAAYAASKGGVAAMTLPAARELARFGIRVLAIAPGIMDTPMASGLDAEIVKELEKLPPYPKRLGRPAEFADLTLHLIANRLMNGEVVRLDGSIRLP